MSHYLVFAVASLISVAIPGPDFLLVFQTSLRKGKKAGVLSAFGIASGLVVHGAFATVGLSALLLKSAQAFEIVKWLGALYLVYLSFGLIVDLIKTGGTQNEELGNTEQQIVESVSKKRYVLRGFLTNVLNIKAALFYVAILPQFAISTQSIQLQLAIFSVIQVVMAFLWFSTLALAVNKLGVFLRRRVVQRWLDGATATLFLGLAGKLISTKQS